MQVKNVNKHRQETIVLALICFLLQAGLSPHLQFVAGGINFMIIFAGVYSLAVGGRGAVIAGFCAGLLFDLISTSPVGLMAALLTVMSYVLGFETRDRFSDGYVHPLTAFGVATFCVTFAYSLTTSLVGQSLVVSEVLMMRVLPSFVLTFVGFLPFAYYLVHASSKGKGLGSGTGKSSSSLSSHYDMRGL